MPRPNQRREVQSELYLSRRIAHEREKQRMTYEGLAQRMTEYGCGIDQSAIYKIEKGKPRRRITVNELVAFAAVLQVPIEDLVLPAEIAAQSAFRDTWDELQRNREQMAAIWADVNEKIAPMMERNATLTKRLGELAEENPSVRDALPDLVAGMSSVHESKLDTVVNSYEQLLDHFADPTNREKS